jgi:hypothetical protein
LTLDGGDRFFGGQFPAGHVPNPRDLESIHFLGVRAAQMQASPMALMPAIDALLAGQLLRLKCGL